MKILIAHIPDSEDSFNTVIVYDEKKESLEKVFEALDVFVKRAAIYFRSDIRCREYESIDLEKIVDLLRNGKVNVTLKFPKLKHEIDKETNHYKIGLTDGYELYLKVVDYEEEEPISCEINYQETHY